jgi:DNA-binding GntR family transcriptional regulator
MTGPTTGSVPTIRRATLTTQVAEQLRDWIRDGTLPAGSQLNETDLAERLGVSRGPLREGLQRLIQEGLLNSQPHRGVFVPVISDEDLVDIYFAREVIEAAAVRRIMGTARPADLRPNLEQTVGEMALAVAGDDWPKVAQLDVRFHTQMVAAAGSPRLSRMFSAVITETQLCLSMLAGVEPARQDLLPEHHQLAQLVMGDDVDLALQTVAVHFSDAVNSLRKRLRQLDNDNHRGNA